MKEIKKDNRGSALIVVVFGIMFLGLLGSMIAAATVMNAQLKGSYLAERETFYTADGILEEIQGSLGKISSRAVNRAYTTYMLNFAETYNNGTGGLQEFFAEEYKKELVRELCPDGNPEAVSNYCDISVIKNLLGGEDALATERKDAISSFPDAGRLEVLQEEDRVVLKNIRIVYTGSKNTQVTLTTDICMEAPSLSEAEKKNAYHELFSYSLLADNGITLAGPAVNGSVYAGEDGITLGDMAQTGSTIHGDAVVSRGELKTNGGTSRIESDSIWFKNVSIDGSGTVLSLQGNTNVADDIEIRGNKNTLTLGGSYSGFGYEMANAAYSSAIMINGQNATIDMKGLNNLLLAGNSFISRNTGKDSNNGESIENSSDILLGSSISVKSEQLAIFVPRKYIKTEENTGEILEFDWKGYAKYAKIPEEKRNLLNSLKEITAYYYRNLYSSGNDNVDCYYFLNFKDQMAAAEFYDLYAEANRDKLTGNSVLYLDQGIFFGNSFLYTSTGQLLHREDSPDAKLDWKDANVKGEDRRILLEDACKRKQKEYMSRQMYLTANGSVADGYHPEESYSLAEHFLDENKMKTMAGEIPVSDKAGNYAGMVYIAGEAGFDTDGKQPGIVLSRGDVTVPSGYRGLVISFGEITGSSVGTTISSDSLLVEEIFKAEASKYKGMAEAEEKNSFLTLFKGFDLRFLWQEEEDSAELSNYITYENWKKNQE